MEDRKRTKQDNTPNSGGFTVIAARGWAPPSSLDLIRRPASPAKTGFAGTAVGEDADATADDDELGEDENEVEARAGG